MQCAITVRGAHGSLVLQSDEAQTVRTIELNPGKYSLLFQGCRYYCRYEVGFSKVHLHARVGRTYRVPPPLLDGLHRHLLLLVDDDTGESLDRAWANSGGHCADTVDYRRGQI